MAQRQRIILKKCVVCGINNTIYTLHKFPKKGYEKEFNIWLELLKPFVSNKKQPTNETIRRRWYLCSKHFNETDFYIDKNKKKLLKKNSIPSNFQIIEQSQNQCNEVIQTVTTQQLILENENTTNTNQLKHMFQLSINKFADKHCEVCLRLCFCYQIFMFQNNMNKTLPQELSKKDHFEVCGRCFSSLKNNKLIFPPAAYWNNIDPGPIPEVIKILTESEEHLLSRVVPYLKIIKFPGRFGQYGLQGQAILFAYDLFEVVEQLPNILPRTQTKLAVVTENLLNLNIEKKYSISKENLFNALTWLIQNNPLYSDVKISDMDNVPSTIINANDTHQLSKEESSVNEFDNNCEMTPVILYKKIYNNSNILHASFHQGNKNYFDVESIGKQCCAMAMSGLLKAFINDPQYWSTNVYDEVLLQGDQLYNEIRRTTILPPDGFLSLIHFDNIKDNIRIHNSTFRILYADFPPINGCLMNVMNKPDNGGVNLEYGLEELFRYHNFGLLITKNKSYGLIHVGLSYYFTNSHSCGQKGFSASNGKACIIQCDTFEALCQICRNTTTRSKDTYSIDYVEIYEHTSYNESNNIYNMLQVQSTPNYINDLAVNHIENGNNNKELKENGNSHIQVQNSVMLEIDYAQPNVEEEIHQTSENNNKIHRKTNNNIVNIHHELKHEELAWFYLFPYGKNGLQTSRKVQITPLHYYQTRILGLDNRFQRRDYLFYALSMFEYYKVKQTISTCGKKITGQYGKVEDLHMYIKKIRGTSSYWMTALYELIAHIRIIGPPQYFMTFSCNDLHWKEMRSALLIADGRNISEADQLKLEEVQKLIEKYPVVICRQFMQRVRALINIMCKSSDIFKGQLIDYWWRVEFQLRGSPHLHMVVWVENYPEYETLEGIQKIDEVCTCDMPKKDSPLYSIVKYCQLHKHTNTCYKNNNKNCRFAFPRKENEYTKIVHHSSNEFINSGGRICHLKRNKDAQWVNNYNKILLQLWEGNMDIQPCGSNEAIAYYIGKYIAKSEPTGINSEISEILKKMRDEPTEKKIFRICMKVMQQRQVSACECVFRLCNLRMRESTRGCIFLNTRKPEKRYRMLQFDDDGAHVGYYDNIFDHYENRPLNHPSYNFENMCLMEFAMLFATHYHKKKDDSLVDDDVLDEIHEDVINTKQITLVNNKKMKIRSRPAIVRVPKFKLEEEPEDFYYSLLIQYLPFRVESELLNGLTASAAFLQHENELLTNNKYMEIYRKRDQELENAITRIHAFNILDNFDIQQEEDGNIEEIQLERNMTEEEYEEAIKCMNIDQRKILHFITESIQKEQNGSIEPVRIFITGGAGTGKTFTLKTLRKQINKCYGVNSVKVCALTGVAARLVDGYTLHTLFKLPVQKDGVITNMPLLTGRYLEMMRIDWRNIKYLFIDEISMVPYEMLCMVESRLRQLKNNDIIFGGLNIIVFGDLLQLPPVRGSPVFKQPKHLYPATDLWKLFSFMELTINMRQHGDNTFIDILNSIRVGELKHEHIQILTSRANVPEKGIFSIENSIRIFPTIKQVIKYNNDVLTHYRKKNTEMFTIKAQDTLVDSNKKYNEQQIIDMVPKDINKTGGFQSELTIFIGAKVMLRTNIDIQKGLVNGATGTITAIEWPLFRRGQLYENDIPSVFINFGDDGIHKITPRNVQFPAKYSYGTIDRRMLPIILSWATTVHKLQGTTVNHAVIYLGKKLFAPGQGYVALSRVKSLEGLKIIELDCQQLKSDKIKNKDAMKEIERLRSLTKE